MKLGYKECAFPGMMCPLPRPLCCLRTVIQVAWLYFNLPIMALPNTGPKARIQVDFFFLLVYLKSVPHLWKGEERQQHVRPMQIKDNPDMPIPWKSLFIMRQVEHI